MPALILIALAGFAAQLVDGGLGMGFGVTSTTLLIAVAGLGPAAASASVHAAQLGTTLVSGISHHRFGNVDWSIVLPLALPGSVAAFAGATVLSRLPMDYARPVTSGILAILGAHLVVRFSRGKLTRNITSIPHSKWFLGWLGVLGGFVDATGGGGWGPITTSTLLSVGRIPPRRVVGTVSTAEFLVTASATAGFALGMWDDLVSNLLAVGALLLGGVLAAPLAAWSVSRLNPIVLGGVVGTLLVLLNVPNVVFFLPPAAMWGLRALIVAVGVAFGIRGWRNARALREAADAQASS